MCDLSGHSGFRFQGSDAKNAVRCFLNSLMCSLHRLIDAPAVRHRAMRMTLELSNISYSTSRHFNRKIEKRFRVHNTQDEDRLQ